MGGKDRSILNITAGADVLPRAVQRDDVAQASIAAQALMKADKSAVTRPRLCEFERILLRVCDFSAQDVGDAIGALTSAAIVVVNRPAAEAGLATAEAGGWRGLCRPCNRF